MRRQAGGAGRGELIRNLIGALRVWHVAHNSADRVLADGVRAVQIRNAAERRWHAGLFEETPCRWITGSPRN